MYITCIIILTNSGPIAILNEEKILFLQHTHSPSIITSAYTCTPVTLLALYLHLSLCSPIITLTLLSIHHPSPPSIATSPLSPSPPSLSPTSHSHHPSPSPPCFPNLSLFLHMSHLWSNILFYHLLTISNQHSTTNKEHVYNNLHNTVSNISNLTTKYLRA